MIRIGRIGNGTKVHMHIDRKGCGAGRGAKLTEIIAFDMLEWIAPETLCKRCFTASRIQRASELNSYGKRWDHALDLFLAKVGEMNPPREMTSAERIEEIRAELAARFRAEGITV